MITKHNLLTRKLILVFVITIFVTQPVALVDGLAIDTDTHDPFDDLNLEEFASDSVNLGQPRQQPDVLPTENFADTLLEDNNNTYKEAWDPWLTRAAIHAVGTYDDWLALASGYLYDNQVHLYRWNEQTDQYDLVWEVGGGIFQSDVMQLAFADTDHNNLIELIAVGEDGRLYVFEQRHIYDPVTNTENQFDLVFKSERLGRIFDVEVFDTDGDYKQDIIVGTADTVRFFEYNDHGGYPFSEDHYIDFEEVFSISMTEAYENYTGSTIPLSITALSVADTNQNGLWEVVVGTRQGTIFLLENNGTVVPVEDYDFPYMRDDNYEFIWSSGNSIQRPITDMESGDLDRDGYKEIIIAVQGQGAYILDEIEDTFGTYRIQRDYDGWESDPAGAYPLDTYMDWMVNSSSLQSVDGSDIYHWDNFTYFGDANVYFEFSGDPEPLENSVSEAHSTIYPYRTAIAEPADNNFTVFDATSRDAWAILDWGRHEEAAGNGITSLYDMEINIGSTPYFSYPTYQWSISLSQDNATWYEVNKTLDVRFENNFFGDDFYRVEVDRVLNELGWDYYRYVKINVTSGIMKIDAMETRYFNKPIYDAQSVGVGSLALKGDNTPSTVGYIGTVNGAILAIAWDEVEMTYKVVWDSWVEERYKLNKNIFDLAFINRGSTFPAWLDRAEKDFGIDLTGGLYGNEDMFTYDADNFYNYRDEQSIEFIFTTMSGKIMAYTQSSPDATPTHDPLLTQWLFEVDLYGALGIDAVFPPGVPGSVSEYLTNNDGNYFAASIVPMTTTLDEATFEDEVGVYDDVESGYWLFVSKWDGQTDPETRAPGQVDVSVFYLFNFPNDGIFENACYPLARCANFVPVFNNFTETSSFVHKTLTNSELTGQMYGIFAQSTWAPKVNGYDVLGTNAQDLIVTNGKVHLLETLSFQNPTPLEGDLGSMFGDLDTQVKPGYFDTINKDSKGRIWTNAEPLDFDNDGDMDLILGFARYDGSFFGDQYKVSYGFTYWENDGTAEEPIWVEKKKAVTNNDPDSNFRVDYYAEPVLVFDEYDFGEDGFDPVNGYHPSYRTKKATRLFLFRPDVIDPENINLFRGTINQFKATYNHPTSLFLATYPEAKRIDINLDYFPGEKVNYGFHIFETWDNSDELRSWTLSVDTADLDQDGNNEVIVGDFNNNAYVFEHLTNNTFKRAYKTQDFNRTIVTNQSPYYHEEFDGITGTFNKVVFDHAEFLLAGVDLNQNGLLEFIVATKDMVFVFESVLTPGGHIQQDTFELVAIIDLLNHPALIQQEPNEMQVTALTYADDATLNGRRELVVGVSDALLIFEIDVDEETENRYDYQEIFIGYGGAYLGLYSLPGNYLLYPDLIIDAILVEDIDQNGYVDFILAGTNTTEARPIRDGFITIFEWSMGEFRRTVDPHVFHNTTEYNPIYDLQYDDQDRDGFLELYIGHESGIDIYEFADDEVTLQEVITSDPHYQQPTRAYNSVPQLSGQAASFASNERDIVTMADGNLGMVYIATYGGITGVHFTISTDEGRTWGNPETIVTGDGFTGFQGFNNPSLTVDRWNQTWVAFTVHWNGPDYGKDNLDFTIIVGYRSIFGAWSLYFGPEVNRPSEMKGKVHPRVFPSYQSDDQEVGLAYLNTSSELFIGLYDTSNAFVLSQQISYPWANGSWGPEFGDHYFIREFDITQLDYDLPFAERDSYGLVLAGYLGNETLSYDDDLFYADFDMNSTHFANFSRPSRTFLSGINAYSPKIIQERDTGNLMITFKQPTLRPYGGLYSIWSDDEGISWQGPYDMSHPLGIDPEGINAVPVRAESSASGESYRVVVDFTVFTMNMDYFDPSVPVLAPGPEGGYTMVYSYGAIFTLSINLAEYGLCNARDTQSAARAQTSMMVNAKSVLSCGVVEIPLPLSQIVAASSPYSNFTWYKLGAVTKMDLGDSDNDGRSEIFAASGKQAFLYEYEENGLTYIKHEEEWVSPEYFYGVSDVAIDDTNNNNFEELVITSERGIVNSFEIIDKEVNTTILPALELVPHNPGTPVGEVDPFIFLPSEFTQRTDYVLYDITEDKYDDIFIIDDYFVGVSDTEQLRNNETYNEVIWAHDVPEFGRYLESYVITDVNGDGRDDLVIAFEKVITALDMGTGEFIYNNTKYADQDLFRRHRNVHMDAFLFKQDAPAVMVTLEVYIGFQRTVKNAILIEGEMVEYHSIAGFRIMDVAIGDFTGDGFNDSILLYQRYGNPIHHYFVLMDSKHFVIHEFDLFGLPGITDVVVGNFDKTSDVMEFMFVIEFSSLGTLFGPDFSWVPSFYWMFGYDIGSDSFYIPSSGVFMGISPFFGATRNYWVEDIDDNGIDDFIGQDRTGALFSMYTDQPGPASYLTKNTGTFKTLGVPYADDNTVFGEFCGDPDGSLERDSFVTTTSGNTIACYRGLDFSSEPEQIWRSDFIDFDVIDQLAFGSLDEDGIADDVMIIGRGGYVYIYDNDQSLTDKLLENQLLLERAEEGSNGILRTSLPWIIGATGFIGILVSSVKYRKSIKKLLGR